MRLKKLAAVLALLACTCDIRAQEVGQYPTAIPPFSGAERLLGDQNGVTSDFLLSQIQGYIFPTGVLGVPVGGTGVSTLTGLILGNGTAPFSVANATNVYTLFGCAGNALSFLNGAGGCTTPAGGGTVVTTGTVTTNVLAAFSGATSITNAVVGDITGLFTGTCSSATFLRGDGSCQTVSGSGTVTSIGISVPSYLSVSPSSITSSGTFAITSASASPGLAIMSPASVSGSGPFAPRAIVSSDLPAISLSTGVTSVLPVSSGGSGATSLTGILLGRGTTPFGIATATNIIGLWGGGCSSSNFLRGDGACAVPAGGGGGSGTVTTTGSPASPQIALFSGSTSITGETVVTPAQGGSGANNTGALTWAGATAIVGAPLTVNVPAGSSPTTYNLPGANGGTIDIGTLEIVQNAQSCNYTLQASDNGQEIAHTATTSGCTFTIPCSACGSGQVNYPIGACITFFNEGGSGPITITINTDELVLGFGSTTAVGSTGSRTLAAYGKAVACKEFSAAWLITGGGLTKLIAPHAPAWVAANDLRDAA